MNMLRLLIVLTILCGALYPLTVTLMGQTLFYKKAEGSLLIHKEKILGSKLLAQKFSQKDFFWSRPSSADFATVSSGASQSSVIQKSGIELREKRRSEQPEAGLDAWTSSGSGLDPHVSPQTALSQVNRVAAARGMTPDALKWLVNKYTEGPTWGIWGRPRVNVLELNMALLMTEGRDGHTR